MSLAAVRQSADTFLDRYIFRITVVALLAAGFFVLFAHRIIITIPAGYKGVLWQRFGGTDVFRTFDEGTRFIWPWNTMFLYNLRFQQADDRFTAADKNGLGLEVEVTTRFRLNPETLGALHKLVGPDYVRVVIEPEVSSHTRTIIARHTAEQVYATHRAEIENDVKQRVRDEISIKGAGENPDFNFIFVEDILLRDIKLPAPVAAAIDAKTQQFHMEQEWAFRREREKIEADRKEIEGDGIRRFQAKVGQGLTSQYLRWRGIEATERLAQSPNTKIVIIGSGPGGLPVILGNEGEGSPRAAAPPRAAAQGTTPSTAPPGPSASAATPGPLAATPGSSTGIPGPIAAARGPSAAAMSGGSTPATTPAPLTPATTSRPPTPDGPSAAPVRTASVPQSGEGLIAYLGRLLGLR